VTRNRFFLLLAFVALFALGWWVGRGGANSDLYGNLDLFIEVLSRVEQNYVDPVKPDQLIDGALKGMVRDLDPYSQYLDARSFSRLQTTTQGVFGGIGAVVGVRDNYPTVISPIEGSPAWRAGVRSGDVIVRIDGKGTAGLSMDDAVDKLRGAKGTKVTLGLMRLGDTEERSVTLERDVITTPSVPYWFALDDAVGYVRLADFSEKSGGEVRQALERLRAQGAKSAILDLRSNPGGLLEQAVNVAEQFLPKGQLVVYTHGRSKGQDQRYYATEGGAESRWPLVVLIDEGSASASEIVAGALQDLDRALVIGRTSFGKGSVQSVYPLRNRGTALKLTTALYYTPSGRSIHKHMDQAALDSLLDEGDDSAPPPPAAADTSGAPRYHTAAGRLVYGGGGIRPDVAVRPDSLPPVAHAVEARALAFRFATRWANTHAKFDVAQVNEQEWRDYTAFLASEKTPGTREEMERERPELSRALRRELARRAGGDEAAAKVALEGDPVFQQAMEILNRAKSAKEVFRLAAIPESGARR